MIFFLNYSQTTTNFDHQLIGLTLNNTDLKIPIGNWRSMNDFIILPMGTHKFCIQAEFEIFLI